MCPKFGSRWSAVAQVVAVVTPQAAAAVAVAARKHGFKFRSRSRKVRHSLARSVQRVTAGRLVALQAQVAIAPLRAAFMPSRLRLAARLRLLVQQQTAAAVPLAVRRMASTRQRVAQAALPLVHRLACSEHSWAQR